MADTVFPTNVSAGRPKHRVRRFAKRLLQVVISYEVITYALATVQATGLTLPAMVDPSPAADAATCRRNLQEIVNETARLRAIQVSVPGAPVDADGMKSIAHGMPSCPCGGRYQLVPSGTSVVAENGASVVTAVDRLAARCVGENGSEVHSGIVLANPNG